MSHFIIEFSAYYSLRSKSWYDERIDINECRKKPAGISTSWFTLYVDRCNYDVVISLCKGNFLHHFLNQKHVLQSEQAHLIAQNLLKPLKQLFLDHCFQADLV